VLPPLCEGGEAVIPAKAGIHPYNSGKARPWMPACAGMTEPPGLDTPYGLLDRRALLLA